MKKLACVLALSGALASMEAQAWGNDGHRVVGAIADQLIKGSNAQKQVAALLLPGESLEKIANWADCVKGTYCGPQSAEMVAYTIGNPKHSEYHYTDVPFQVEHYHDHDVGTAEDDVVQTLRQAIAVLQGKDGAAVNPHHFTKRQALLILTHLAGDITQPLHVGAAYVGKDGGLVVPEKAEQIDAVAMFDARGGNNLLLDEAKIGAISAGLIPPAAATPPAANKPAAEVKPVSEAKPAVEAKPAIEAKPVVEAKATVEAKPAVDAKPGVAPQPVPAVTAAADGKAPVEAKPAATPVKPTTRPFHSYWDSTVVDYAMRRTGARSPDQFAQMVIASRPDVAANTGDPASWPYQWADDALVAAKIAYADVKLGQITPQVSKKGETYYTWALDVPVNYPVPSSALARAQLIKGGYHLAAVLQAIWPNQ